MSDVLTMFPFAAASSACLYLVLLLSCFRSFRNRLVALPVHRVGAENAHLGGFDAYRGLAALFVAIGHMWYFPYPVFASTQLVLPWLAYGSAAVPIFCILSGFLIHRSASGIVDMNGLKSYVVRRFFRIYPVYVLGVLACLALGLYGAGTDAVRSFFADLFMFRVLWWPGFQNVVAWSLYHEVMFYLAMPIIFAVFGPRHMLAFAVLGLIAMCLGDAASRDFGLYRYFLIGIAASILQPKVKGIAWPVLVVGAALLTFDLSGEPTDTDWAASLGIAVERFDRQTIGIGLGFGMILAATPHIYRLTIVLESYLFRLLGTVSYSLFILHPFYILISFPIMDGFTPDAEMFKAAFAPMPAWYLPFVFAPGAVFWAIIAYKLIEEPGIRLGKTIARRVRTTTSAENSSPVATSQ